MDRSFFPYAFCFLSVCAPTSLFECIRGFFWRFIAEGRSNYLLFDWSFSLCVSHGRTLVFQKAFLLEIVFCQTSFQYRLSTASHLNCARFLVAKRKPLLVKVVVLQCTPPTVRSPLAMRRCLRRPRWSGLEKRLWTLQPRFGFSTDSSLL